MRISALPALLVFLPLSAQAVPGLGQPSTPDAQSVPANLAAPAMVDEGRRLYQQHCTQCHGADGNGGVRLAGNGLDPASAFRTISQGRTRGGLRMPMWKGVLTDEQIWALSAYLMSLK